MSKSWMGAWVAMAVLAGAGQSASATPAGGWAAGVAMPIFQSSSPSSAPPPAPVFTPAPAPAPTAQMAAPGQGGRGGDTSMQAAPPGDRASPAARVDSSSGNAAGNAIMRQESDLHATSMEMAGGSAVSTNVALLPVAVPEPASLAVLGIGLAALAGGLRRSASRRAGGR